MTTNRTFEDLGLSPDILEALTRKGFERPTPIQEQTIPLLLAGEANIIAQAQTGTGKTAAFGLPILERIQPGLRKVQAIILAPTRELASQVAEEIDSLKAGRDIRVLAVYGGQGMDTQLRQLRSGVDIVVATPGRAIDHLNRKTLKLDQVRFVVLDEADEMLNMGFIEDIDTILSHTPAEKRMLFFSATIPAPIQALAGKYMGAYEKVAAGAQQKTAINVEQVYYEVQEKDKLRALQRLIDTEPEFYALVFCRTRRDADRLAEKLNRLGHDVEAMHGEVTQNQRERILAKFKGGHSTILVATDVAARGIDVNDLTHVINFDLPDSPDSYVHRIGRTGRAGKTGKAITFITPNEFGKLRFLMKMTKVPITKGQLPSGQTVVEQKKAAMMEKVLSFTEDEQIPQEFYTLAGEIMASSKPKQILAALLQMHFGGTLNPASYPEIAEPRHIAANGRAAAKTSGHRPRKTFGKKGKFHREETPYWKNKSKKNAAKVGKA